jgi:hypothetical protein
VRKSLFRRTLAAIDRRSPFGVSAGRDRPYAAPVATLGAVWAASVTILFRWRECLLFSYKFRQLKALFGFSLIFDTDANDSSALDTAHRHLVVGSRGSLFDTLDSASFRPQAWPATQLWMKT